MANLEHLVIKLVANHHPSVHRLFFFFFFNICIFASGFPGLIRLFYPYIKSTSGNMSQQGSQILPLPWVLSTRVLAILRILIKSSCWLWCGAKFQLCTDLLQPLAKYHHPLVAGLMWWDGWYWMMGFLSHWNKIPQGPYTKISAIFSPCINKYIQCSSRSSLSVLRQEGTDYGPYSVFFGWGQALRPSAEDTDGLCVRGSRVRQTLVIILKSSAPRSPAVLYIMRLKCTSHDYTLLNLSIPRKPIYLGHHQCSQRAR